MATTKISEMQQAVTVNTSDLFEASLYDSGTQTYSSGSVSVSTLATKIATGINFTSDLQTTAKTLTGAINEAAQSGGIDVIADEFDSTSTYAVGDYCTYAGKLYKCTTAITTAGAWDSNNWTETLVMDEVSSGGGGGSSTLAGLTDVDLDNLADGQILVWDDTNSKWVNADNQGGGSGNAVMHFTKTSLYTASQIQDSAPLSQDISNFDLIEVVCWYEANSRLYTQNAVYNADELIASMTAQTKNRFLVSNDSMTCWFEVEDTDELKRYQGDMYIKQVYGYKFGIDYMEYKGTLEAGETEITFNVKTTEDSTLQCFTTKFGVNPTDIETEISDYTFTTFYDGQVVVRENNDDPTDKKIFFCGFVSTGTKSDLPADLVAFVSPILTSTGELATYDYVESDMETQSGWIGFYNNGGTFTIRTWTTSWGSTTSGTFYGVIDLSDPEVDQTNPYIDPYLSDTITLTFPVQANDLQVKVRLS